MGQDSTKIFPLGPAQVEINGVNVGHIKEGGSNSEITHELVKAFVDKHGKKRATNAYLAGSPGSITKLVMMQCKDLAVVKEAFPGIQQITDGSGNTKITWGYIAGTAMTPVTLTITSDLTANATAYQFQDLVICTGKFDLKYTGKNWELNAEFEGMVNESSGADGSYGPQFGYLAATSDASVPTFTLNPADTDAGVPKAAGGTVVATSSKALDPSSVTNNTVALMLQDGAGASAWVTPTSLTLSANGLVITFTYPLLAGTTAYNFVIGVGVKTKAGVHCTGSVTNFTTGS